MLCINNYVFNADDKLPKQIIETNLQLDARNKILINLPMFIFDCKQRSTLPILEWKDEFSSYPIYINRIKAEDMSSSIMIGTNNRNIYFIAFKLIVKSKTDTLYSKKGQDRTIVNTYFRRNKNVDTNWEFGSYYPSCFNIPNRTPIDDIRRLIGGEEIDIKYCHIRLA